MNPRLSLDQIRKDTPGVEHVLHFNNAGSALPPQVVLTTVVEHLKREATIGGYEAAAEASERLEAAYTSLAKLIGADPSQIAMVENATRAWDMAVYGYPFAAGDRVLTSRGEYVSNVIALLQLQGAGHPPGGCKNRDVSNVIALLQLQERHRIETALIEDDERGQVGLEHLEVELARGAAMVTLTHAPTNSGLINPAEAVGSLCEQYGVFYVLDACQSAGQVPLDVGRIKCDVLSGTGRKYLRGPRGTGFLYAGPQALERIEPPFLVPATGEPHGITAEPVACSPPPTQLPKSPMPVPTSWS